MASIAESLHQIMACEKNALGDLFYQKFFSAHPEARRYFEATNLKFQAHMLLNGLQMVVALSEHNYIAARSYLKVLGHRHYQREIPRELFPVFRDTMLSTLREFHLSDWNEPLEQQWRAAFDLAIEAMLEGYTAEPVFY